MPHFLQGTALHVAAMVTAGFAVIAANLFAPARADTAPPAGQPETLTARPLPTWQTNGTVWSIAVVGDTTYVGGNFTHVRPPGSAPGQNFVERRHIAAFDSATGALLPWRPRLTSPPQSFTGTPDVNCNSLGNGQYECASVWSLRASPNQQRLYVGGAFQLVDGQSRPFVAAFDLPSGALNPTFQPRPNGRVYALAATNTTAFLGGSFRKVNGISRARLAAVSTTNQLLPWNPWANDQVKALALTADESRLVVGGRFNRLDGGVRQAIGAVTTTGEGVLTPWAGGQMSDSSFVTSLTTVGSTVYVTGEDGSGGRTEGVQAVNPTTGTTVWTDSCRGASHSSAVLRGVVYVGSHSHDCSRTVDGFTEQYSGFPVGDRYRYRLRAVIRQGDGSVRLLHWFPHLDDSNGPRAMATDGSTLWVGGEFKNVDTGAQQGLTRYTFDDRGGSNAPPLRPTSVRATAIEPGEVHVTWQTPQDRDNRTLSYQLIRDGNTAAPIHTTTRDGRPWLQPWLSYVDTGVTSGIHSYSVRAIDPSGQAGPWSYPVSVTVPTTPVAPHLVSRTDGAAVNYRFEEATGTTEIASVIGGRRAKLGGKASLVADGRLGRALALTGVAGSAAVDTLKSYAKRQASVEALFRTTSTRGGALLSMGTSPDPGYVSITSRDLLYMSDDGRLNWGFRQDAWPASAEKPVTMHRAVSTTSKYNDGAWHHVVATFEPGTGARIYVDGDLMASSPALNSSRTANAHFRIGGDRTQYFPNRPWSGWWTGTIDEVAGYDYPLSQAQVAAHAEAFLTR